MTTNSEKKTGKRVSLAALILSAIVFGFVSGLGGSLILSRSLIHKPLQQQQQENALFNLQLQKQLQALGDSLALHHSQIVELEHKIEFIIEEDNSSYVSSLYKLQKDYFEKEKEMTSRMAQLEKHILDLQDTQQSFAGSVDKAKDDLDAVDGSLNRSIQELNSSLQDLENRIKRLERNSNY